MPIPILKRTKLSDHALSFMVQGRLNEESKKPVAGMLTHCRAAR